MKVCGASNGWVNFQVSALPEPIHSHVSGGKPMLHCTGVPMHYTCTRASGTFPMHVMKYTNNVLPWLVPAVTELHPLLYQGPSLDVDPDDLLLRHVCTCISGLSAALAGTEHNCNSIQYNTIQSSNFHYVQAVTHPHPLLHQGPNHHHHQQQRLLGYPATSIQYEVSDCRPQGQ